MEKNIFQKSNQQEKDLNQEALMNRVNQTFDQFVQDVRNMLDEKDQEISDQ